MVVYMSDVVCREGVLWEIGKGMENSGDFWNSDFHYYEDKDRLF